MYLADSTFVLPNPSVVMARKRSHEPDSQQQQLGVFLSSSQCQQILHYCKYGRDACQCIALPNTALLDCILCMIQAFYQALQIGVSLGTCI